MSDFELNAHFRVLLNWLFSKDFNATFDKDYGLAKIKTTITGNICGPLTTTVLSDDAKSKEQLLI